MYKKEFEELLKTKPPRAVMLFGENEYLVQKYTRALLEIVPGASVLKQYFGEFNIDQALEHLLYTGLFSANNVLLVKTDKKIDGADLKRLIGAVKTNEASSFILEYYAEDAKEKSKYFTGDDACFVRLFKPSYQEAFLELKAISKLPEDIIAALLTKNSLNLSTALKDLEKIALYPPDTPKDEILALIASVKEAQMDDLLELLIAKKNVVPLVARMLLDEDGELAVITGISNAFGELFAFWLSARVKGQINSKDFLGYRLPPQLETKRGNLALKIKQQTYLNIQELLLKTELELKEDAKIHKRAVFLSALIKLQEFF